MVLGLGRVSVLKDVRELFGVYCSAYRVQDLAVLFWRAAGAQIATSRGPYSSSSSPSSSGRASAVATAALAAAASR